MYPWFTLGVGLKVLSLVRFHVIKKKKFCENYSFFLNFQHPQSTTHEFMLLNLELSAMENKFDDMVMMGKAFVGKAPMVDYLGHYS